MNLNDLAAEYAAAKDAEAQWAARRRELAAQIQAATGHDSEGQKTYDAGDWKITVKAPLIRSMDWAQWEAISEQIPENLHPVRYRKELDEKGVQWLADNDPHAWAILAPCLTTKPGAVQVTVKPVEEN